MSNNEKILAQIIIYILNEMNKESLEIPVKALENIEKDKNELGLMTEPSKDKKTIILRKLNVSNLEKSQSSDLDKKLDELAEKLAVRTAKFLEKMLEE